MQKREISISICALFSLTVWICLSSPPGAALQAAGVQELPAKEAATPKTGAPSLPPDPLENDARLDVKVTLRKESIRVGEALHQLTLQTGIKFKVEGNEVTPMQFSCAFVKTPLKEVLASLVQLSPFKWERRADLLVLRMPYNPRYYAALNAHYLPHT